MNHPASPRAPRRFSAERFERIYERSSDPWEYVDSPYEQSKYRATLAALPPVRLGRVLEVGCSIGAFSAQLARRCEELVAIDFSARAVTLARERLRGHEGVHVLRAAFPEEVPPGRWELVVCSEVLYYLDSDALLRARGWLREQLAGGSSVLAVSWRGKGSDEPFRGDEVHDTLIADLAQWHALDARDPGHRLDRFDGDRAARPAS